MIGYARAASGKHGVEEQKTQLIAAGATIVHLDIRTGGSTIRPALQEALSSMSRGDVLAVTALDRLARGFHEVFTLVGLLDQTGLHLVAIAESIDTRVDGGAFFTFCRTMLAHHNRAAQDRALDPDPVVAAMTARPGPRRSITDSDWHAVIPRYLAGELNAAEAAELLGVNRATFFREKARREGQGD